MSRDVSLAFAHPEARAIATAPPDPLDRISLRGHVVEVEIGAFQAERDMTQRISFDVVVEVVPLTGPVDDDVDRILSYDRVTEAITIELAAERLNLLETLAERVADRILIQPQAQRVFVRIQKLDKGSGALGVEIVRARQDLTLANTESACEGDAPSPRVVYLSNAAMSATHLSGVIDELSASDAPVILCLDAPDAPLVDAQRPLAERHIWLLAIAQNAWRLSGLDPRCVVVESRTELDWGMRNGQISVWAPSKIVMDAVDGPTPCEGSTTTDSLDLAHWFAGLMQAREFVAVGAEPLQHGQIPTRSIAL